MAESKKTKAKKTPKAVAAKAPAPAETPAPVAAKVAARAATPKPAKPPAAGYDRKARAAIAKLADFVNSLDGLPSRSVEQRNAALDACRDCGWEG